MSGVIENSKHQIEDLKGKDGIHNKNLQQLEGIL